MSNADTLAYISAFFCGVLVLIVAWSKQPSVAHWAFIIGMVALAAGDICFALTTYATTPEEMVYWQYWKMVAMSFLPGTWLLFQSDLCAWKLFGISEKMAPGFRDRLRVTHRAGHFFWQAFDHLGR